MRESTESLLWDFIEQNGIATADEMQLVTCINGWNEETMMDIIYARTGNRSVEQCQMDGYELSEELLDRYGLNEEDDEEDDEDDEEGED